MLELHIYRGVKSFSFSSCLRDSNSSLGLLKLVFIKTSNLSIKDASIAVTYFLITGLRVCWVMSVFVPETVESPLNESKDFDVWFCSKHIVLISVVVSKGLKRLVRYGVCWLSVGGLLKGVTPSLLIGNRFGLSFLNWAITSLSSGRLLTFFNRCAKSNVCSVSVVSSSKELTHAINDI